MTRAALGLVLVSGILIAGCAPKAQAPANPAPATNTPPPAAAPTQLSDQSIKLEDYLPTTATYKMPDGTLLHWKVTRDGDQIRVEETSGTNPVAYHYILQIKDGALVQTKYGNSNIEFDRQRTWFTMPLKPFTSQYSTEDSGVKEDATEEWTNSEEFGRMLHVHLTRTFTTGSAFTIDEYYKAGVGLYSQTVTDKNGKVVYGLNLVQN